MFLCVFLFYQSFVYGWCFLFTAYHLCGPSNLCCNDATVDFPRAVVLFDVGVERNFEEGFGLLEEKLEPIVALVSLVGGFWNVEEAEDAEKEEEVVDEGHFLVSADLLSPENDDPVRSVGRL